MADSSTTSTRSGQNPHESLREPGDRGQLTIADRVVEQVAVLAARQIDGVATTGSSLKRAVGRQYPRAEAHVAGHRVRVVLQIAVTWPASLPQVAAAVRDSVAERVTTLVGMHVDAVDVSATTIVQAQPRTRRVQ